jgi:hypothetical protein
MTFLEAGGKLVEPGSTQFPGIHSFTDTQDTCRKMPKAGCCIHNVEKTLPESWKCPKAFLKEMQKRHPNQWVGRGDIQVQAQELFTMMQNDPGR